MTSSRVDKFRQLSSTDRALLLRSVLLVAAARIGLWLLPFNAARRMLARSGRRSTTLNATAERIGWAISVAKGFIPKANCLPQGLAAESLLTRNGHAAVLRIGVVKNAKGRLEAHMWVESDGVLVVGDLTQGLSSYTPLPPLPGVKL